MTKQRLLNRALRCAVILVGMIVLPAVSAHAAIINADFGDQFVLADLIASQDAILIGDKKFDLWGYVKEGASNNMPNPDSVVVIPTLIANNIGITFQGGFLDAPVDLTASDASIFYRVMVTDENKYISDAHLSGNLSITALGPGSEEAVGVISVVEEFFADDGGLMGEKLGEVKIDTVYAMGVETNNNEDWIIFDEPQKSLIIRKDILAWASEGIAFPTASLIDQTFSQTPEPGTLFLLATAGVTICLSRRWRRRSRW